MIELITDSCCDLPEEVLRKYNIHVVPLTIRIGGKEYAEGIDLSPQVFYEKMDKADFLPKTSQPAPAEFAQIFKNLAQKGEILCLTVSSKLSGAFQSAQIGKEIAQTKAEVFDTLAGSLGQGLQVIRAAQLAAAGVSLKEIVENLSEYRKEMNILVQLNALENIVKGGRLSRFQGSVAKLLKIKVLLEGIQGEVEMLEKIRSKNKAIQRLLEIIGERKQNFSDTVFGITHVNNIKDAEFVADQIKERFKPKEIIINYMGSTFSTYAGQGGIIVSF